MSERLDNYVRTIRRRLNPSLGGMHALAGCATGWGEEMGNGYFPHDAHMRVTPTSDLGWLLHSLGTAYSALLDYVVLWTACSLVFENQMSPEHAAAHTRSLIARRLERDPVLVYVTHRYPHQALELAVAQELGIPFVYMDQHVKPMVTFPVMFDADGDLARVTRTTVESFSMEFGEEEVTIVRHRVWGATSRAEGAARDASLVIIALQCYAHGAGDRKLSIRLAGLDKRHRKVAVVLALQHFPDFSPPRKKEMRLGLKLSPNACFHFLHWLYRHCTPPAPRVAQRLQAFYGMDPIFRNFLLPHN